MTSREASGRGYRDRLGAMISWTLRESVANVEPPPGGWRRINERLLRQAGATRAEGWGGFRVALSTAALWFVQSALAAPVGFAYCDRPELLPVRERYDLCLLMYQNDLPMLLGQAV